MARTKTLIISKTKAHTHKYKLVHQYPGQPTKVYRCMLPNCRHFLQLTMIEGQLSVCWACANDFVIKGRAIGKVRPICDSCLAKSTKGNPNFIRNKKKMKRTVDVSDTTIFSRLSQQLANAIERENDD